MLKIVTAMEQSATLKMVSALAMQGGKASNVRGPVMAQHLDLIVGILVNVKMVECATQ